VHTSHMYEATDNRWIVTVPAWQGMTDYAHKVAPASVPTFGGLAICLENERVEVKRRLFTSLNPVLMEVV
jgi:hypothetical protein